MRLVLLGPPGAGKGTQAERLAQEFELPHVASGDLFRENLRNETELGLMAREYMDKGELVPDDVTIAMVRDRLQRSDCTRGVILDGFPRTLTQAQSLDRMLTDLGHKLDGVIYLAVPDEELVRRLSGRWLCVQCQAPYHTIFSPPSHEGACDACGGALYQRDDDKPDTVRARLNVYRRQTAPLIDYYRQADLLVEVDGVGSIETVSDLVLEAARGFARGRGTGRMKAAIDATSFGSITIEGRTIHNDVVLGLDGTVGKRQKQLSKKVYGTSHTISLEEAKHVYEKGAESLIIGTGRFGLVHLSDEADQYFRERGCQVQALRTPQAIQAWNEAQGRVIGLFHITC